MDNNKCLEGEKLYGFIYSVNKYEYTLIYFCKKNQQMHLDV
jgi:hypothetical protein